eukprot:10047315-Ditylum_brightwellii.AAC.1
MKTWPNFKVFFREAQKELHCTGKLTVEEIMNHTKMIQLIEQGVHQALANHQPEPTPEEGGQS